MKDKIMRWNYKKAFITVILLAIVLALVSAVAVPLSLSQQLRDAHTWEQTAKTERMQEAGKQAGHDGSREHGDWEQHITPLHTGHFVLFGALAVLWLALGAVYWLLVIAWLYKNAVREGMNKCSPCAQSAFRRAAADRAAHCPAPEQCRLPCVPFCFPAGQPRRGACLPDVKLLF